MHFGFSLLSLWIEPCNLGFPTEELPVKYLDMKAQGKKAAPISLLAKLPGQKSRFWLVLEKQSSDEENHPKQCFQAQMQALGVLISLLLTVLVHSVQNFHCRMLS